MPDQGPVEIMPDIEVHLLDKREPASYKVLEYIEGEIDEAQIQQD